MCQTEATSCISISTHPLVNRYKVRISVLSSAERSLIDKGWHWFVRFRRGLLLQPGTTERWSSSWGVGPDAPSAVHCHQLKSLEWRARKVRLKETVPQSVVDEVLARIEAILFE
jgi:hypothetical protein